MALEINDYPHCCGMKVVHNFGHPSAETERIRIKTQLDNIVKPMAERLATRKTLIATINDRQKIRYELGALLESRGFECVTSTISANTGNVLHVYVREASSTMAGPKPVVKKPVVKKSVVRKPVAKKKVERPRKASIWD